MSDGRVFTHCDSKSVVLPLAVVPLHPLSSSLKLTHMHSQITDTTNMMSEKKKGCVIFLFVCLRPAVFSVHPAAGGCADVHPRAVLEILRGAAAAVGPQLHHGRAGPLLQPRCDAGQTAGHVRAAHLGGVGRKRSDRTL